MSESKPLKTETSVINSPTHNKQLPKTEATDKKVYIFILIYMFLVLYINNYSKYYSFRFENSNNAPHMLGNSLNPSSSVARKMSDNLSKEIETHKMFNNESNSSTSKPKKTPSGPQIHRRNQKPQNHQVCRLLTYTT